MPLSNLSLDTIVKFCRRKGFVYPSSEIYGGFAATYDFGPLGMLLKKNLVEAWRYWMVDSRTDVTEIEGAIFLHPKVWEASGHIGSFADLMVEDLVTHKRYRADHLIEDAKVPFPPTITSKTKLLVATHNKSKIERYKKFLSVENLNLVSPKDLDLKLEEPLEDGSSEMENAKIKAKFYFDQTQIPSFSNDTGLYFEGFTDELQPKKNVKGIAGVTEEMNQEQAFDKMIQFYSNLAKNNGGELDGYFLDTYCLFDGENYYTTEAKRPITLTDKVNKQDLHFPICSLYKVKNVYYHDLNEEQMEEFLSESIMSLQEMIDKWEGLNFATESNLIQKGEIIDNAGVFTPEETDAIIEYYGLKSPDGNPLSKAKKFNLLVKTHLGPVEDETSVAYLKGESCQNIYVDWKQVQETTRRKLPFGIAQLGKAFRNEITVKQYLFRTRELEQIDLQYFVKPGTEDEFYNYWKQERYNFYTKYLGYSENSLKWHQHGETELSFYSKEAWDIYYKFGAIGYKEMEGLHNRTDYDTKQHQAFSGVDLTYLDPETNQRYLPYIVEMSLGVGRLFLSSLFEFYDEEKLVDSSGEEDTRTVLRFPYNLAPHKIAVLPLMKKDGMSEKAFEIYANLRKQGISADFDESGSVGKRYRRQDENGTPWSLTVDYDTLEQGTVTLRHRDSMQQVGENGRIKLEDLAKYLSKEGFGK